MVRLNLNSKCLYQGTRSTFVRLQRSEELLEGRRRLILESGTNLLRQILWLRIVGIKTIMKHSLIGQQGREHLSNQGITGGIKQ